ncbi:unnamed protein product [Strongylus vulgaris]|uniref:Cullin N-terminal domain-containing protein n=1 Tax=Strongylus vulgaris TaxID=40348 RepID=A0A3P7IRL9_STRVU|nr:unnamed protein product [Strongylus vulgaris]
MFGFGCLLHVLLIHSSLGVFHASKLDFASATGLPFFNSKTLEVLHANGLHGEVVRRAAEHSRECGTALLDYSSYTNGLMFDGVLKSFEETLMNNYTLDETLREFYITVKGEAVKLHTKEVRKAFERYASIMPHFKILYNFVFSQVRTQLLMGVEAALTELSTAVELVIV